jgi:hypothetical protein
MFLTTKKNAQQAATVAQSTAQNAADVAQTVAQNASDAAQTAAVNVSKGVRQGVFSARRWAAPRIENAADYATSTVAPKVAAVLRNTAEQVNPQSPGSKSKSVLKWSALGAAIAAGLGAVAALVRSRYRAAIEADTETADEAAADTAAKDTAAKDTPASDPGSGAGTSVNGRVSASGR